MKYSFFSVRSLILGALLLGVMLAPGWHGNRSVEQAERLAPVQGDRYVMKKARSDYYERMLRDPETGLIPPDIRKRELMYARTLPDRAAKSGSNVQIQWLEAGPNDIGGRTRALAVDRTNSDVILAGGVAGGIWKSTDQGETWELKTDPTALTGVTSITQEPRDNQTDTWYAVSGEFFGSNSDRGRRAPVYGEGMYRSTDGGESWSLIASAQNPAALDSPFDLGTKVLVSPATGTVFVASQVFGLNRIIEPGATPVQVLGTLSFPEWTDFDIAPDGAMIAVTSEGVRANEVELPGVFYSTDDGLTWQDITPANFPATPARSVIAFAPSDPGVAYLWTFTGVSTPANNAFGQTEESLFYAFTLPDGTSEDRSANLPNFGGQAGHLYTQRSYDMALAVKPDDPNDVFLGGTNLYRSRDGFATPANNISRNWVGGYAIVNNLSSYTNHHPDQHALFFDPQNPDALWSGHDGGLSYVADVSPVSNSIPWQDRNNGYNVTQYYHVSISSVPGDPRILGGTQDNGSPYFTFDPVTQETSTSRTVSSGDGGYSYLGQSYGLSSFQLGELIYLNYNASGVPLFAGNVTPPSASDQIFITPFAIDPFDEGIVYYPGGNLLWRGKSVPLAPSWSAVPNAFLPFGYAFSALAAGIHAVGETPSTVLYLAASGPDKPPILFRMDNAAVSTAAPADISIDALPDDAYIHAIAVHPDNGNELLVVASNYNITGLYHSADGGAVFMPVEGNLTGTANDPGPSLRSASILPSASGTTYLLGTSTGVYSTEVLAGENTVWTQEAAAEIGHTIIEHITSRASDGRIAVATHGRGIFTGTLQNPVSNERPADLPGQQFVLQQNHPNPFTSATAIGYSLDEASRVTLTVYDVTGRIVQTLVKDRVHEPGDYTVDFDSGTLSSGMYIYHMDVSSMGQAQRVFSESRTMILSR